MLIKKFNPSFTAVDGCSIEEGIRPSDGAKIPYSNARATVGVGKSTDPHTLEGHSEMYYILQGMAIMNINNEEAEVSVGDQIYIPDGSTQWIKNKGNEDLVFLAIVSPPYDASHDKLVD